MTRKGGHVPDTPDQPDARPPMARPARNPAVVWVVSTPLAWIALIVFCFAVPLYFAVSYGLGLSPIGGVDIPDCGRDSSAIRCHETTIGPGLASSKHSVWLVPCDSG